MDKRTLYSLKDESKLLAFHKDRADRYLRGLLAIRAWLRKVEKETGLYLEIPFKDVRADVGKLIDEATTSEERKGK